MRKGFASASRLLRIVLFAFNCLSLIKLFRLPVAYELAAKRAFGPDPTRAIFAGGVAPERAVNTTLAP